MTKRRRTLPPVSPKVPAELRPLISAMTEILETGEGVRGDPLDRKITLRDLVDSGIGKMKGGVRPGSGGGLIPGVEPPAPDLSTPPPPQGFAADGSFFGRINLSWQIPSELYRNHAYTNIYRSEEDNFANAVIVGREVGAFFSDYVRNDALDPQDPLQLKGYYYWITFTSTAGVEGPPNSGSGTYAEPLADMEYVLSILSGQLSESELADRLNDRIDLIDGPDDLTGSVAQRIREEALARIQAIETEAEARIDALQEEESARKVAIQSEASARESEDAALGRRIDSLTAAKDEVAADLAEEREARVSGDSALSRSIDAYYARTTQDTQAAIAQERQARTQADSAITEDVTTLRSRVSNNESAITNEQQTRADADSALASAVNSLTARLDATPMWVSSFEPGADFDRWTTQTGGTIQGYASSYAGDQAALMTHSGGQPLASGRPGTVSAKVPESLALNFAGRRIRVTGYARQAPTDGASQFAVAYSTADVGNSGWQRFSVNSTWSLFEFLWDVPEANNGGADYIGFWADTSGSGKGVLIDLVNIQPATTEEDLPAITAAIQVEQKARAEADGALAEQINTTQAQLGDDIALAQTRLTTEVERIDDELVAMGAAYTAQVQANGLIGGFGVYNDGTRVDAAFDVDRFWIGRSEDDKTKPFMVVGGKTYIDVAMIRDASIQEGKLGPITIGKLQLDDGTPVTTVGGLIRADAIDVDNLAVAEAATFTGIAQSANYAPGGRGWIIHPDGNVEFNQGVFNGQVEFKNVTGAGALASKDSLDYTEVAGTKPPTDADKTGSNTAYDTARVAGSSASNVRQWALNGNNANTRVNDWVRPNTTLINGNKIYTGDAYVDTLQLKGQAVTIPASAYTAGEKSIADGSWTTVQSVSFNPEGGGVDVFCVINVEGYSSRSGSGNNSTNVDVYARLLRNGSVVADYGMVFNARVEGQDTVVARGKNLVPFGFRYGGLSGTQTFEIQMYHTHRVNTGYTWAKASNRFMSVKGVKR